MSENGKDQRQRQLLEQRRALPDAPGVYVFADADGRVLYVGKSLSIRKRVANHFSSRSTLGKLADHFNVPASSLLRPASFAGPVDAEAVSGEAA